ncbi:MAG: elongation factor P maturation arginine rhamnosyltransferase EarP [Azoarcus sp.]|nr:elongation factor P maturation arginine rhamnosyltransferase EarP [Azoarcus sp.]
MNVTAVPPLSRWEVFCRIVDNYGDIGVCWRLARALVAGHGVAVRLWVDDWATLERLCTRAVEDGENLGGIELRRWLEPFPNVEPADVVIEAFGCELPPTHVRAMATRAVKPVWINLEYLSAEDWVSGCHGLASPQANVALTKYFFFPGFAADTGGLIREKRLFERRDRVQVGRPRNETLTISLFGYEHPGLAGLLQRWRNNEAAIRLLIPEGRSLREVNAALDAQLKPGDTLQRDALQVEALPFVDQDAYDELLWTCDLNFVRGEDSFVRAQWAAKPLVWQIYPQEEDAHLAKLDAFLMQYRAGLDLQAVGALGAFWHAWNGCGGDAAAAWPGLARALPALEAHAVEWCDALREKPNLVDALWDFCRHIAGESG